MLAFGALAIPVRAQETSPEVQRALIERDQQSDAFSQQLRQSQERLQTPEGPRRQALESQQADERRRLDELHSQQMRDAGSRSTAYERSQDADTRRPLIEPYRAPDPEAPRSPRPLPLAPGAAERAN